ncbi:MAG: hypothetical protein A2269_00870 [Lentisphaerae bacterium RIFOXYA12_FULL_60_10]|nr:MAG: hypothetical protein A2269_00870 [Lentisphaerae bacterium RIFOXYA12_FULL_60_10]
MRYLIDTNVLVYAAAGEKKAVHFLHQAHDCEWVGYSAITRLELFGYPDLKLEDEGKLRALLACFEEVEVTGMVIDRAIAIRKEKRIKVPDAILAASALVLSARLATRNVFDFKGIKGLQTVDPLAP